MLSVICQPHRQGFSYRVEAPSGTAYTFDYIVVGSGGHQQTGEIHGTVDGNAEWIVELIPFQVVHVGLVGLELNLPDRGEPSKEEKETKFASLSRSPLARIREGARPSTLAFGLLAMQTQLPLEHGLASQTRVGPKDTLIAQDTTAELSISNQPSPYGI